MVSATRFAPAVAPGLAVAPAPAAAAESEVVSLGVVPDPPVLVLVPFTALEGEFSMTPDATSAPPLTPSTGSSVSTGRGRFHHRDERGGLG
jgi:hypothetical protein